LRSKPLEVAILGLLAFSFRLRFLLRVAHVIRVNRTVLSGTLRCPCFLREITFLLTLLTRHWQIISVRIEADVPKLDCSLSNESLNSLRSIPKWSNRDQRKVSIRIVSRALALPFRTSDPPTLGSCRQLSCSMWLLWFAYRVRIYDRTKRNVYFSYDVRTYACVFKSNKNNQIEITRNEEWETYGLKNPKIDNWFGTELDINPIVHWRHVSSI